MIFKPHRRDALWCAHLVHRVSGVGLALFLPLHFYVLGLTIEGSARLDAFLSWAEAPAVKAAEWVLVFLLAVHLFGGLRLLALEFLPWSARQKTIAALSFAGAFGVSLLFLLGLL